MKARLALLCTLLSILLLAIAASAQNSASVVGTVKDPTGATIANAQVRVANLERGIDRSTASNADGEWAVNALPAGKYNLIVIAPGFKKFEARDVVLEVAQKARVEVAMQVGAASTEVTVEGSAIAQVETQSSDLAGTVTGKEISQLQLNGRNFSQLATLVAGVSNQSGQDEAGVGVAGNVAFSVQGGRTEYNNWELDGGDNMDNGSNTTLNVYPSIDAIAEFKVLTSDYGAQYGRSGSGTVEVETKSGTSHFHGDAYEFLRNDAFNAITFPQTTNPAYKKNDFGYTIGGPVFIPGLYNTNKQKTFFFWSQEWRRDRVFANFSTTAVPSKDERQGNFSDLCPNPVSGSFADCPKDSNGNFFPGNIVPIDSVNAPALIALIPESTGGVPGATTWSGAPQQPVNWREELLRVDHNFNSNVRATVRYIHDSWEELYPTPLWTNGTSFPTIQTKFTGPGVSLVTRLTATVSPTLLNEFVFSYTTDHITLIPTGAFARPQNMTFGIFQNGFAGYVPGISFTGGIYGGIGEDAGYLPNGPYNSNPTYTYRDNLTKIVGKHNLQFGAYFVAAQKNELSQPGTGLNGALTFDTSSGVSSGNAFADLLMGNVANFAQTSAQPKFYNRYKIVEPYLQDDWHASSHLTLNLGLRLSLFGTYRERYHNEWNFDTSRYVLGASSTDPVTGLVIGNPFNGVVQCGVTPGVPASCMKGHLFNPAPRLGFAWDPKGDGKTAIRGGYGIFFEHTNGNEANAESLEPSASPTVQTTTIFNIVGYSNIASQGPAGASSPLAVVSIPNKAVWPYIQQWHFDIQRELYRNTVATVSYVGSKGTHLIRARDLNQVPAVPLGQNPYKPGEPIDNGIDPLSGNPNHDDCNTMTTPSGVAVTGQAAINLSIACGGNPDPFRTSFPGLGGITGLEEKASSIYHAFEVSVRRSVGALQLSGSYTFSHSIDDSSSARDGRFIDSFDLSRARASSNFDQRHLFNLGYVYDLPFFKNPGLTKTLLGGWQWSGITAIQTGSPFSVSNSQFSDNGGVANTFAASNSATSYPDLVGNPTSGIQNFPFPAGGLGPLLFNPSAFAAPRGLTFGDTPRNYLRNPRRTNFDMALFKHFAIKESVAFEFRAEAFNVFNHREYSWLGGDTGSASSNSPSSSPNNTISCYAGANNLAGDPNCTGTNGYLRPAAAHLARILQLGAKFIF
jgi:hypothetical protein